VFVWLKLRALERALVALVANNIYVTYKSSYTTFLFFWELGGGKPQRLLQAGPSYEPVTYPGYSKAARTRQKNAGGARTQGRGSERGRGRGRGGAGPEIDAELSDLLAQASDTELDSFYLSEILDEKFVREQRQYLIRREVSVTSKHKNKVNLRAMHVFRSLYTSSTL
jgi:hypothetical protein